MQHYNLKGFGEINVSLNLNTEIEAYDDNDSYSAVDDQLANYAQEIEKVLNAHFKNRSDVLKIECTPEEEQYISCDRDTQANYWEDCETAYNRSQARLETL